MSGFIEVPTSCDDPKHLRLVRLSRGYTLRTWDTGRRGHDGKYLVGYQLCREDGSVVFTGEDFGCAPSHSVDSDEALRGILTFLTLRPGDTDPEYFQEYTQTQLDFASGDAEELSMHALDDGPLEFENLDGWEG